MTAPAPRESLWRDLTLATRLAWAASRAGLLAYLVVLVPQGLAPVAVAWLTKTLLDGMAAGRGLAVPLLAALAVALLATTVAGDVGHYFASRLRREVDLLAQRNLFLAAGRLPGLAPFEDPALHDRLDLGEQAAQTAPSQVVTGAAELGQAAITLTGFTVALIAVDPLITATVALVGLATLLVEARLGRARAGLAWQLSPAWRRAFSFQVLQTDVRAAKEIRVYGLTGYLHDRMAALLRSATDAENRLDSRVLRGQALLAVCATGSIAFGLVMVARQASAGAVGVGGVSFALAALLGVQTMIAVMVRVAAGAYAGLLLLRHYRDVATDAGIADPVRIPQPDAVERPAPRLSDGIRLRDVWFRYDEQHPWALRGVDLTIPRGRTVAIVGLNGAGKSTLIKLLCRFYEPTRGTIRWDDTDLAGLPPEALRRRMTVVFQDFMEYDLTAAENIGVGDLSRMDDLPALRAAAARAGVDDRLTALPRGYRTLLTRIHADSADPDSTGVTMSGGGWQRIAIARALLRDDSDLLILDEPSSGLDPEAEAELQRQLRARRDGRTIVIISHRLSAVREADTIVVLADGRITESGAHDELIAAGGRYAELFAQQASGYAPVPQGA
ncbi:multidrug ABC transporter permease [Actinoplanes lobatus]|uniref:ATP-binding cassette subfamily B protein n=1 Tax=Actinoplanes lobatus TaxID=113568 RepID=A0A7W7MGS2_9ACTN|nr:ABC transporter ATP-binding protein [Actinoplanes lobatus]MBB4749732.1 ATP-binding cassette subfamily B protein [Actinoplanes lobatus]GGN75978.1 multidrug ABC transporter permease [Actinoplanes lobatus]GIE38470.1 multidrug ABC transporter permease [Actinoplanes lobatus]